MNRLVIVMQRMGRIAGMGGVAIRDARNKQTNKQTTLSTNELLDSVD